MQEESRQIGPSASFLSPPADRAGKKFQKVLRHGLARPTGVCGSCGSFLLAGDEDFVIFLEKGSILEREDLCAHVGTT